MTHTLYLNEHQVFLVSFNRKIVSIPVVTVAATIELHVKLFLAILESFHNPSTFAKLY